MRSLQPAALEPGLPAGRPARAACNANERRRRHGTDADVAHDRF
jgi:hypothetical protein